MPPFAFPSCLQIVCCAANLCRVGCVIMMHVQKGLVILKNNRALAKQLFLAVGSFMQPLCPCSLQQLCMV